LTDIPADIVTALQQRWIAAFNQRDLEGLVALYSDESCLFGGKPDLSINRSGIRTYFNALPPVRLRADTDPPAAPTPFGTTLTVVDTGAARKIASRHASPVAR
jgi:hypothetical protein